MKLDGTNLGTRKYEKIWQKVAYYFINCNVNMCVHVFSLNCVQLQLKLPLSVD